MEILHDERLKFKSLRWRLAPPCEILVIHFGRVISYVWQKSSRQTHNCFFTQFTKSIWYTSRMFRISESEIQDLRKSSIIHNWWWVGTCLNFVILFPLNETQDLLGEHYFFYMLQTTHTSFNYKGKKVLTNHFMKK